jgi:hypothetical protein
MKPEDSKKIRWVPVYRREPTFSSDMIGIAAIMLWLSEMDGAMPWFLKALSAVVIFFGVQQLLGEKKYRCVVRPPEEQE